MVAVVRHFGAGVVLMHMLGTPATMQVNPTYVDVIAEVTAFLQTRLQALANAGIAAEQAVLDPGVGFGKRTRAQPAIAGPTARVSASGPAGVSGRIA